MAVPHCTDALSATELYIHLEEDKEPLRIPVITTSHEEFEFFSPLPLEARGLPTPIPGDS